MECALRLHSHHVHSFREQIVLGESNKVHIKTYPDLNKMQYHLTQQLFHRVHFQVVYALQLLSVCLKSIK